MYSLKAALYELAGKHLYLVAFLQQYFTPCFKLQSAHVTFEHFFYFLLLTLYMRYFNFGNLLIFTQHSG